ncbi:MAG: N-acetylmuramoyl-L-alanine amidase [Anaerolineae bacterium]|nr:N-acetylmuramoyl-L-alanine amidase [Anaerolineae bacterium]
MKQEFCLNPGESLTLSAPSAGAVSSQRSVALAYNDTAVVQVPPASAEEQAASPPWVDVRAQMPVNTQPDTAWLVEQGRTGWWKRTLDQVNGITLHHTMTHDMMACAQYITRPVKKGGKGYPTTQYVFWVQSDGVIKYCVDLTEAPWHDHCGDENTHISIGIAGEWDKVSPPQVQLEAVAKLAAYLMRWLNIPMENVEGHREWSTRHTGVPQTACPGWLTGGWRAKFFDLLKLELDPLSASFSAPELNYAEEHAATEALLAIHNEDR